MMRLSRLLLLMLLPLVFVLGACSDFDEMKSRKLQMQAERLLEEGEELQAEDVLAGLLESYPKTRAARTSGVQLKQLRHRRMVRERQEFARVLDSYRQVFNGYRSVYAAYPTSLEEFDASGYFFDSDYLAEITTDGFEVYLWLTGDSDGFRAWSVRNDKERGYLVDGASKVLVPFGREQTLTELKGRFEEVERKGNLVVLTK